MRIVFLFKAVVVFVQKDGLGEFPSGLRDRLAV